MLRWPRFGPLDPGHTARSCWRWSQRRGHPERGTGRAMPDALIIDACRTPRDRQAGKGRAGPPAPAAPRPDRPRGAGGAQRLRHRRRRRRRVGHELAGRDAERRPRSHVRARRRLRRAGERRDARPLLRLGDHGQQHRGERDHGRDGGPGHRGRHRDDVVAEEGPHADGCGQRAPAVDPPAVAPGRVRRRDRDARGHPTRGPRRAARWSRSGGPTARSPRAGSSAASSR